MRQYFSRLAERSGVATTAHALQSRSTRASETTGWGEQSSEVIAQPTPLVTDSNAAYLNPIVKSARVYKENFSVDATTEMPETHRRVPVNSTATSEPSSIASNDIAADFHSPLNMAQSLPRSSSLADEVPITSDFMAPSAYVAKNDVGERNTIDAKPSKKIATKNLVSAVHRQSKSMIAGETAISSAPTASAFDATNIIKIRANNKFQSTERIASQPAQVLAHNETGSRSSSRSSVQVHIGKIELEIHAPTKPVVRAPQPARTIAAPAKTQARNTVFNPHRHYLRGR